jgi:predicted dehydrogenase
MADDGVHQLDIARWLTGVEYPTSVRSTGGNFAFKDDREVPDTLISSYDFDDMIMTFELTGWAPYMKKTNNQIRFGKSFPLWLQNSTRIEFYGSKNLMVLGRHGGGWQVFTGDGEVVSQEWGLFPDDVHKENFVSSIKSRKKASASAEEGHRSALLVHLANIAYRVGNDLRFDRETETFVDNAPANELAKGHYREKFSVPDTV